MSLVFHVLLVLGVLLFGTDSRLTTDKSSLGRIPETALTRVRVADFSTLPPASSDAYLDEEELKGVIQGVHTSDDSVQYGAYNLEPWQLTRISYTISAQLTLISAADATLAPVIEYPGRQLKGSSVLDTLSDRQPKRIPTIYAPFYSGYKFALSTPKLMHASMGRLPSGTTLHFSNVTIMVANATYESIATSGMMSYFSFGTSARLCFTNSMFVLESCKGFRPNSFHMWCCTKSQCNIEYTERAIEELGYPIEDPLELLTCHDLQPSGRTAEDGKDTSDGGVTVPPWAVATAGGSAALLLVVISGVLLVFRSRRLRSRAAPLTVYTDAKQVVHEAHMQESSMHAYTPSDSNAWKEQMSTQLTATRSESSKNGTDRSCSLPHAWPMPSNAQQHPLHPHRHPSARHYWEQAPAMNANLMSRQEASQDVYTAAYPPRCTADTLCSTATVRLPAPRPGASKADIQEYIQYQIDTLDSREVLNGLVLQQGIHGRLLGGQAVVQMAKDRRSNLEYAIKFYMSRAAFEDEAALYAAPSSPLGQFLPAVRDMQSNEDGTFLDAHGAPLPPCISMEKGESLDLWSARNGDGVDMITALQVIHHIAERLEDLHDAGYCHRDLKPGNVMWLPRRNRWTLIDFGCAAHIGEDARIGFSLAYAAPEVIHALRAGQSTMTASDKLDAWSLGVLAVELLTNEPAYPNLLTHGKEKVMDMIAGVRELPWEAAKTASGLLRRFGHFRVAVMGLLQREPADRLSMAAFRKQCKRVLMQTTTIV